MHSRGTHQFIEHYWQVPADQLPKPIVFYRQELIFELGHLVGSVFSGDFEINGKPLIHAVIEGRPVELIGGRDCNWSTDADAFDLAVGL